MPEIFHYTSATGLAGIVRSRKIWATDFRFLNDPQELLYGLNIFEIIYDSYSRLLGQFKDRVRSYVHSISRRSSEGINSSIFITSFSRDGDLLSQWRGYNSGLGFNIGFDETSMKAQMGHQRVGEGLYEVIYETELQHEAMIGAFNDFQNKVSDPNTHGYVDYLIRILGSTIITFKHRGYREEQELRIIRIGNISGADLMVTPRGFKPYIQIPLTNFRNNSWSPEVRSVRIGPALLDNQFDPVKALLLENDIGIEPIKSSIPYISN